MGKQGVCKPAWTWPGPAAEAHPRPWALVHRWQVPLHLVWQQVLQWIQPLQMSRLEGLHAGLALLTTFPPLLQPFQKADDHAKHAWRMAHAVVPGHHLPPSLKLKLQRAPVQARICDLPQHLCPHTRSITGRCTLNRCICRPGACAWVCINCMQHTVRS